jgi:sugar phosphate isomerase/epimerase
MKRRDLLKGLGVTGAILPSIELQAQKKKSQDKAKVQFFAPTWGNGLSLPDFCKRVKDAGYHGIETPLSFDSGERNYTMETAQKHGLLVIAQYYQSFDADPVKNLQNYEKHLRNMISAKPLKINTQTGKDYFTFEQNKPQFELATKLSKESGIPIVHETHRGKALFSAHNSKEYFQKLPEARITLDISHWCNVAESLLADQVESVALALGRADHIHSRVGHGEGPQVNDPRAPEWKSTVEAHLAWWDKIYAMHAKAGTTLTVTTEFGPATYMPVLPYTQQPVASQWDINVHMMNLLRERWKV